MAGGFAWRNPSMMARVKGAGVLGGASCPFSMSMVLDFFFLFHYQENPHISVRFRKPPQSILAQTQGLFPNNFSIKYRPNFPCPSDACIVGRLQTWNNLARSSMDLVLLKHRFVANCQVRRHSLERKWWA
jgi:hypothetical protein